MGCKICGRASCATSFHSIEEQEAIEEAENMSIREVMYLIIENKDNEKIIEQVQDIIDNCDTDDEGNKKLRNKLEELF